MELSLYSVILFGIIIVFSVLCSLQDVREMKIYNFLTWGASFSAIVCHLIFNIGHVWVFLLSGISAAIFYYFIRKVTHNKLGMGDVFYGMFQGMCISIHYLPFCIMTEVILALIFIKTKSSKERKFPFIPFMSGALMGTYLIVLASGFFL